MSAVWVVRPPVMTLQWPVTYYGREEVAREILKSHHDFGVESTLTRETLLTPEQAAVLEAATALRDSDDKDDNQWFTSYVELCALKSRVDTLRAQEGA